jgi:hypothetical protein
MKILQARYVEKNVKINYTTLRSSFYKIRNMLLVIGVLKLHEVFLLVRVHLW